MGGNNMKKAYKRIISSMLSVYVTIMIMVMGSVAHTYAIPGSNPRIYVDIVYQNNGTIRADVIFENMPDLTSGGFYINVGDGWNILPTYHGAEEGLRWSEGDTVSNGQWAISINGTGRFIAFTCTNPNAYDYNGRFCYFLIERTNINNPMNSTFNCTLGSSGYLNTSDNVYIGSLPNNPVMLSSYEYVIGDANGDGYIDARDATEIATVTSGCMMYNVYSIRSTYTSLFPDAVCAAAPDGDESGVIDSNDATVVLQAYAAMMVGNTPTSNVGQIAIYEVFQ
jgi:hypothetical protein